MAKRAATRQPRPPVSLLAAMTDPKLFGAHFAGQSWSTWITFVKAFAGEPMTAAELDLYRNCTGREEPPRPGEQARQAWVCCGRRAGKSRLLSMVAIWAALILDWRPFIVPGETAVVMIFAADRQQAKVIFSYILAMLRDSPLFRDEIASETRDEIVLRNGISIQIATSSFRSLRGRTVICALLDELAFWYTGEASAQPDSEIIRAVLASQASLRGNGLFLAASSPYSKTGALYDAVKRYYGKPGPVLVWTNAPSKLMNSTISDEFLAEEQERDPEGFSSEYEGRFRDDISAFVTREVVDSVTVFGRYELPYDSRNRYIAFCDPSGGSSDSMVLCLAYRERESGRAIMAALREHKAPFDPGAVVASMAELLKAYRVGEVRGDRYAGEWPADRFREHKIRYVPAEHSKTEIYANTLPLLNCNKVELLDAPRLAAQLVGLERRTTRGSGREIIDHKQYGGAKDDVANAACGALLLASDARRGGMRFTPEMMAEAARRPNYAAGDYGLASGGRRGTPWPLDPAASFPTTIVK
jgi:hypothetical protein